MLFALGGISVDLWRSFSARRALASGADAAALAGASAIDEDALPVVGRRLARPGDRRSTRPRQPRPSARPGRDARQPTCARPTSGHGRRARERRLHAARPVRSRRLRRRGRRDRDAAAVVVRARSRVVIVAGRRGLRGGRRRAAARRRPAVASSGPDTCAPTARDLGAGTFPGGGLPGARAVDRVVVHVGARAVGDGVRDPRRPGRPELADACDRFPARRSSRRAAARSRLPVDVPAGRGRARTVCSFPPDAVVVGDLVVRRRRAARASSSSCPRCVGPGTPLLGEPPSPAEIWQQTPLPRTERAREPARHDCLAGHHASRHLLLGQRGARDALRTCRSAASTSRSSPIRSPTRGTSVTEPRSSRADPGTPARRSG